MKKGLSTLLLIVTLFIVIGCGGNSSNTDGTGQPFNASDILLGKTLYYTDSMLDDPEGYFSNAFLKETMVEKEYDQDGNVLYSPDTIAIKYEGNNVTFSEGGLSFSCSVVRMTESTVLECQLIDESVRIVLWDTVELAKANPDTESGENAKNMLLGKTFYSTDDWVNDYNGYYTDTFLEETSVGNTYDADGTPNNAPFTRVLTYRGTEITLTYEEMGLTSVCSVERMDKSIVLDCINTYDEQYTKILWETVEEANTHRYD